MEWYRAEHTGEDVRELCLGEINDY
jgi:hypothetical protein